MLRAGQVDGIDPDLTSRHDVTVSLAPASSSVLARVAETLGGLPRILLRDTDPGEEPSPLVKPGSAEMPAPAERPDRYQLFGEIARGGMGAVLHGRDSDLGRDLAVKVLLESHKDKPDLIRRFIEEAQIGGQLQHPGVVPVYDIGAFADRRPFFTMKLVKGRTLAALLAERETVHRRQPPHPNPPPQRGEGEIHSSPLVGEETGGGAGTAGRASRPPRPSGERVAERRVRRPASTLDKGLVAGVLPSHTDLPRFLSIFEQVCQTMAYAHTRGVIHRDLKPSNIMVGSFGEVQVMDWGLAKVLPRGGVVHDADAGKEDDHETVVATARSGSSTELSQAGSVLGTPAYMPPEQARGEIDRLDERADVFALGSILCEILTGEPAFTGRSSSEILRKAGRGDLGPALARLESCDAEPELIGLAKRCLAPERDDRPHSAGVVAEAVTAYLASVQRRLRAAELTRVEADARAAFERKRRLLTVALAASIIGTILVAGGGWAWNERQRQEHQRERQERAQRVELVLREAQLLLGQAEHSGDDRDRWIVAVDAARAVEQLANDTADEPARRTISKLLKTATEGAAAAERDRELIDRLNDQLAGGEDDPDGSVSEARIASAFREAGFDVDRFGVEAVAARIRARPPDVVLRLASSLTTWANRRRASRPQDVDGWKRLVAAARGVDPDPLRNRLRDLWSESDPRAHRDELLALARQAFERRWPVHSLGLLGITLIAAGEKDAVLELDRRAQLQHPDDAAVNANLGMSLKRAHPPQIDEAIRFLTVARVLRPETGHVLAHLLEDRGRLDEAQAIFDDLTRLRPSFGGHWVCLAAVLRQRGDKAADAALEKAVAASRERLRSDPAFPHAHCYLAKALAQQGKLSEAVAEFREGIRNKPDDVTAHSQLAELLRSQGKTDEAIAEYRTAIRLGPGEIENHYSLGVLMCDTVRNFDEAAAQFREVIRLKPDHVYAHISLGNALRGRGNVAAAISEYREAIRLDPDLTFAHNGLGIVLCDVVHDYDAAVEEFQTAIRLKPDDITAHSNLSEPLWWQGKFAEAQKALRRARDLARGQPGQIKAIEGNLAQIERQAALAARLPAVLRGEDKPKGAGEVAEFAEVAFKLRRYAASAQWYAEAFRAKPALAQDLNAAHRYSAARAAAMAGAGKGEDQPPRDERARGKWRQQALDWLQAELAVRTKQVKSGSAKAKFDVRKALEGWKLDRELAGIRDEAAMAALPESEHKACRALWAAVDKLR
jgi:serine/threonine-protein kinase